MTHALFLDLSFDEGALALFRGETLLVKRVMSSRSFETPHLVLEELLATCQLRLHDIQALAVAVGPGSYTGLRNAVAVVKTIAYSSPGRGHLVVPVPSLIAYCPPISQLPRGRVAIVEEARLGGIYIQKVDLHDHPIFFPAELVAVTSIDSSLEDVDILASRRPFSWFTEKIGLKTIVDYFYSRYITLLEFQFDMVGWYIQNSIRQNRTVLWHDLDIIYL